MSDLKPPIENVPQCLRDLPQWVCWRYVERDGKRTKVPIDARTGRSASATDRVTWATFEAAHEAYLRADNLAGVGFVFTKDDPFAGIDLDRCLDEQGEFIWGRDIVDEFSTYADNIALKQRCEALPSRGQAGVCSLPARWLRSGR